MKRRRDGKLTSRLTIDTLIESSDSPASAKQSMKGKTLYFLIALLTILVAYLSLRNTVVGSCLAYSLGGFREVADERSARFLGKVKHEDTSRCRGGQPAVDWRGTPWVDWQRYWATGDEESRSTGIMSGLGFLSPNTRGVFGALLDMEYQRIELLQFNLFDNSGTFETYVQGQSGTPGPAIKSWPQLRLPPGHSAYAAVGGDGPQRCQRELIRFRNLTGICNDMANPLMGSTNQSFARNVPFDTTFPDLGKNQIVTHRHGDRLGLLKPDPQVISRKLFSRAQAPNNHCNDGLWPPDYAPTAECDYQKAPVLNVLAAFWIQFMTHDWFSHLEEGHNQPELMAMGCKPLNSQEIEQLHCRPEDRVDRSFFAADETPATFTSGGKPYLTRSYKTTLNRVTAWWDASQIYGYDELSRKRVKRDPGDPAKLLLETASSRAQESIGYLPLLQTSDYTNVQWSGQESVAFPDNWNIGLSFFHNVFAREHNIFVDAFRKQAAAAPNSDSGLRDPANPAVVIRYKDIGPDELFEIARLVVAAEIAKVHTIEWTPQLLYNEPAHLAMNANWSGLTSKHPLVDEALKKVLARLGKSTSGSKPAAWYSVFATGPGIVGLGNQNPDVNGGVHHFGSPFNFPEEFVTVYRLHSMVPDLIELRELRDDPNAIRYKIPVVETLRGKATQMIHRYGLADWALSMGRQRSGQLTLQNHPLFLQNLSLPRLQSATGKIDVLALDIIRDRERGVPRYNEFRRQYGLKQLASFDDFRDSNLSKDSPERARQQQIVRLLREVYGQHKCDDSKIITTAQVDDTGGKINDCLGHPNGSMVDNIEDVDAVVGWLAEFVRPHGFAISETQFQVFILNASRRLFSDRFFTSSFRPEFYTHLGIQWINENGPNGVLKEKSKANGHETPVSPLKRVLQRTIPELKAELDPVVNVFDPWARDRGAYYSLKWKPRPGAESDVVFRH
jgi:hypothetical protein